MTDATYALHVALLKLARGALNVWERWVLVTSGSVELPRRTTADLASATPARQTVDDTTQPSAPGDDRHRRSAVMGR